jgi:altronate hydrolase
MKKVLKVNASDNIIVALQNIKAGENIDFEGEKINILQDIAQKHKFAAKDFAIGDILMMYGVTIGKALKPIFKGERISTENVIHATNEVSVENRQYVKNQQIIDVSAFEKKTFQGYHRSDGRVGTMNYWLVVPLVFCENRNINVMKEAMLRPLGYLTEREQYIDIQELIQGYQDGDATETFFSKNIFSNEKRSNYPATLEYGKN